MNVGFVNFSLAGESLIKLPLVIVFERKSFWKNYLKATLSNIKHKFNNSIKLHIVKRKKKSAGTIYLRKIYKKCFTE